MSYHQWPGTLTADVRWEFQKRQRSLIGEELYHDRRGSELYLVDPVHSKGCMGCNYGIGNVLRNLAHRWFSEELSVVYLLDNNDAYTSDAPRTEAEGCAGRLTMLIEDVLQNKHIPRVVYVPNLSEGNQHMPLNIRTFTKETFRG